MCVYMWRSNALMVRMKSIFSPGLTCSPSSDQGVLKLPSMWKEWLVSWKERAKHQQLNTNRSSERVLVKPICYMLWSWKAGRPPGVFWLWQSNTSLYCARDPSSLRYKATEEVKNTLPQFSEDYLLSLLSSAGRTAAFPRWQTRRRIRPRFWGG